MSISRSSWMICLICCSSGDVPMPSRESLKLGVVPVTAAVAADDEVGDDEIAAASCGLPTLTR